MFQFTRRERFVHWVKHQQARITDAVCLLVGHDWQSYQSYGSKMGRDGIVRDHIYTNFRCARCWLDESTYTQYDLPRTLPDWWNGITYPLRIRIEPIVLRLKNRWWLYQRNKQARKEGTEETPF